MRFFPRSPLPSLGHLKLPEKWATIAAMAQLQLIVGLSLKNRKVRQRIKIMNDD
jgi:hypothetical protein